LWWRRLLLWLRFAEDADLDAHILVHFVRGGGVGVYGVGVTQTFVAEMGGVEALCDEIVIDEFRPADREDKPIDLEVSVCEVAQIGDTAGQCFFCGVGEGRCVGDEIDVVETEDGVGFVVGTDSRGIDGWRFDDGGGVFYVVVDDYFDAAAEAVVAGEGVGFAAGVETDRWRLGLRLRLGLRGKGRCLCEILEEHFLGGLGAAVGELDVIGGGADGICVAKKQDRVGVAAGALECRRVGWANDAAIEGEMHYDSVGLWPLGDGGGGQDKQKYQASYQAAHGTIIVNYCKPLEKLLAFNRFYHRIQH
jgi:hypothetical protein